MIMKSSWFSACSMPYPCSRCHPTPPARTCNNTKQTAHHHLHHPPTSVLGRAVPPHTHRYVPLTLTFFLLTSPPTAPPPLDSNDLDELMKVPRVRPHQLSSTPSIYLCQHPK